MNFIFQSVPDIPRKLQKLEKGPHTLPQTDLLELAFKVLNNRSKERRQAHTQALEMVAAAVSQAVRLSWTQRKELGPQCSAQPNQPATCFKCGLGTLELLLP